MADLVADLVSTADRTVSGKDDDRNDNRNDDSKARMPLFYKAVKQRPIKQNKTDAIVSISKTNLSDAFFDLQRAL